MSLSTEKKAKILREAKDRFRIASDYDRHNRIAAYEDMEFIANERSQWPEQIRKDRELANQPCLVINKLPVFIDQVVGDQRQNRPSIKVIPVDSNDDINTARILGGWMRHVQSISKSDIAIDHGFEHAVACGYGAVRVITDYVSDMTTDQEAYIKKIDNALAVYWGPCSEYDCSDAMYCFVVSNDMSKEEFEEKYKEQPVDFASDSMFVEYSKDTVRLAEYFVKEPMYTTIYQLSDGTIVKKLEEGQTYVKKRDVKSYKIMWYLLSGDSVLDYKEWPGKKYIPIIPIWGKEFNVGGKRYVRGLIRNAKDVQRMYNYWSALSLRTPIPTPDGWLTLGQVDVGTELFDEKGNICTVTKTTSVFQGNCYEIVFDDGSSIIADAGHLWTVEERGKRRAKTFDWATKTITTEELIAGQHFIQCPDPLELPEKDLSIPPYVLGAWLGDGSSREPNITQLASDADEMEAHLNRFGISTDKRNYRDSTCTIQMYGIRSKFSAMNLLGNKHIPYNYIRGSFRQRLELLQGLMDTDGSINIITKSCDFTTTNKNIADGMYELLHTLGIKAKFVTRERGERDILGNICATKTVYQFYFTTSLPVFRLSRKLDIIKNKKSHERRTKRFSIVAVIPTISEPVKCITVDSESSLFLAGYSMVPTHNSIDTEVVALQPRNPYFVTPEMIQNHQTMWDEAGKKNRFYLLFDPDRNFPSGPKREAPPQLSSALTQKIATTDQEMRDVIGLQKASLGMQSNERSGAAIRERKQEGDTGTFAFIDNLSRSIEHVGRVLLDIAPTILDTERIIRLGLDDGEFEFDAVNVQSSAGIINDLSVGTFDVVVTTGPSFTTQRSEARQSMQEFIQYYPAAAPLIGDLYAKAMDWVGAEEFAERLTEVLPPAIKLKAALKKAKRNGASQEELEAIQAQFSGQQSNPVEESKVLISQIEVEIEKIKLLQEQEKLKALQIKNQLEFSRDKQSVEKAVDEILAERLNER